MTNGDEREQMHHLLESLLRDASEDALRSLAEKCGGDDLQLVLCTDGTRRIISMGPTDSVLDLFEQVGGDLAHAAFAAAANPRRVLNLLRELSAVRDQAKRMRNVLVRIERVLEQGPRYADRHLEAAAVAVVGEVRDAVLKGMVDP